VEKLKEGLPFLKPTLNPAIFTSEGIDMVCALFKSKAEEFTLEPAQNFQEHWNFPSEMITAVRVLQFLGTHMHCCNYDTGLSTWRSILI